jgi:Tfp pilus assembly protein PilZ
METESEAQTTKNVRQRLKAGLRVYYGPSQSMLLQSFSVNLSSGGLFFKTEIQFSVDERLLLSFTLPEDNEPICSKARVAWVNLQDNQEDLIFRKA